MDDTVNNGSLSTVVGDLYLYERGDECRLLFWYIMRLLVRLDPLGARQKNHPLCGCASKVILKKLQTRYNKGVQANCEAKGEKYGAKGT